MKQSQVKIGVRDEMVARIGEGVGAGRGAVGGQRQRLQGDGVVVVRVQVVDGSRALPVGTGAQEAQVAQRGHSL